MRSSRAALSVALLAALLSLTCAAGEAPDPEEAVAERNALAARAGAPLFGNVDYHVPNPPAAGNEKTLIVASQLPLHLRRIYHRIPLDLKQSQAEFIASRVSALNQCFY